MVSLSGEGLFSDKNNNCALFLASDGNIYPYNKSKETFELTSELLERLGPGIQPDVLFGAIYGDDSDVGGRPIRQLEELVGYEKFERVEVKDDAGRAEDWSDAEWSLAILIYNRHVIPQGLTRPQAEFSRRLVKATERSGGSWSRRIANIRYALTGVGLSGGGQTPDRAKAWQLNYEMTPEQVVQKAADAIKNNEDGRYICVELGIPTPEGDKEAEQLGQAMVQEFYAACSESGIVTTNSLLTRYLAALLSKRFLILTGLAGSGKTKLAQAFVRWITDPPIEYTSTSEGNNSIPSYVLVPVGADWTGSENVLGYPDGLRPPQGGVLGKYISKPALELILKAMLNTDTPHFLILDEMNLSHVERYFADFLSMIESRESITLYCDEKDEDGKAKNTRGIDPVLSLPDNLFVIGTVNVDETTYMFSPKVLDRANVIEFRVSSDEMKTFLSENAKFLDIAKLDGKGTRFSKAFVQASVPQVGTASAESPAVPKEVKTRYDAEMNLFFAILREHGSEFGYRVAYEGGRFIHFYKLLGDGKVWNSDGDDGQGVKGVWSSTDIGGRDWFDHAFDALIVQKFLPKLHGSKVKLGPLLRKIYTVCVDPHSETAREASALAAKLNKPKSAQELEDPSKEIPISARYPITAEKIFRMWRQLNENGFTSFPEN
ncbi:MAG: McrB family protein [Pyrinomonadaceae bacterium]